MEAGVMRMPPIVVESDIEFAATDKLGFGGPVASRLTVGRSDALPATAVDAIDDPRLAAYLAEVAKEIALVRLTLRLSFRPARDERFEQALLSIVLAAPSASPEDQPFARVLSPERLESGPYKLEQGMTFGFRAEVPHVPVGGELKRSNGMTAEIRRCYVVAAGIGESDPEWRYQRTKTMELEGLHEMGMIVQLRRGVAAEARLALVGDVHVHHRVREVTWSGEDSIARVPLFAK